MKNSKKLLLVLGASALLASCAPKHTHNVAEGWQSDDSQHWHVCVDCEEKLDVANHTYSEQVANAKYLASSATCLDAATYYKSCECGAFDPTGETFVSGEALGHDWQAAYLDKNPTKVNYQVGETFDWTGVVIKRACGRTGCMETETLDNSLFTVVYDNGGSTFAAGESKVTLVAENEEPIYVTCIQVAKKENQITGPESIKTTCTKAPDISGYNATSGGTITAKYYKDGVECTVEDLVKDAGTFVMKLTVAESQEYSSAEKTVSLEVDHNGEDTCDCGEIFKENIALPTFRKVTIDLSATSVIDLTECGLNKERDYDSAKVYVGETEIASTFANGKVTIDNSSIPTSLTAGEHDDIKFVVSAGEFDTVFTGSVLVATKVIKTVEDFKYNCSTIFTGTATSGPKNDNFGAGTYYVLGNDLSGEAGTWTYKVNGLDKAIWHSSGLGSATGGFKGTFDGN
ncbi:MAG: hypothetical protein MJ248_04755, partial [Bacilli bacterium]|nr:hypothetical protein [Bacilli bacterium]